MNLFNVKKHNLDSVTQHLTKALGIKMHNSTISKCLREHPDYPSILSLSDCLKDWKIPNKAYRFIKTDYNLTNLSLPFIAHLEEHGGKFVLIHNIDEENITFSDEQKKSTTISNKKFFENWDGIIVHAQKGPQSGEINYFENALKYFFQVLVLPSVLILFSLLFIVAFSTLLPALYPAVLSVTKLIGLLVSIFLLMQTINAENPFIKNLCGLGGKNDCNAILNSRAAKLTDWLSWSEIGFFYFSGTLLLLLINPSSMWLIMVLNLFSLPYTIYSFSYQYKVKKWCVLCCSIQVVLISEFVCAVIFGNWNWNAYTIINSQLYLVIICLLSPIIIWSFLKQYFLSTAQLKPLKRELNQFKFNNELFKNALSNQPIYNIDDDLMPIVLGNELADITITMVTNPNCTPCSVAHKGLTKLLESRSDIKIKLIFFTSDSEDERAKVARHLTTLAFFRSKTIAEEALNDWYKTFMKYENWQIKYPIEYKIEVEQAVNKQREWCDLADIDSTPTFFINGQKLPDPYKLDDVKYLLS
ncbi:vitamin K epoxide reductase family protein [Pedobacter rhodius]|uniref:Thioredoxin domain-containing protein n=1 Tax=Pedobacter rhodius TaxID=3004098 RepID=A0ABT4KUH5_9SPHI|nr:vitamin K epoxide reductase family protein [Pedobacter sp. SJ11]MCZ4222593.1 thioredoxin domain-containing protein [Pedobacter sp. SJ11]